MRNLSRYVVAVIIACGLLAAGLSCAKKVTKHIDPPGVRLYIGDQITKNIYVFDAISHELVDSLPEQYASQMVISEDGRFVFSWNSHPVSGRSILKLSASPMQEVAALQVSGMPILVENKQVLLAADFDTLWYVDPVSFRVVDTDTLTLHHIAGADTVGFVLGRDSDHRLISYDFRRKKVIAAEQKSLPDGAKLQGYRLALHRTGTEGYGLFNDSYQRAWFITFKTPSLELENLYQIVLPYGYVAVSPDGKYVLFHDPGDVPHGYPVDLFFVYDVSAKQVIRIVDLDTLSLFGQIRGATSWIDFSPDGSTAFVSCGGFGWGSGPVLIFDMNSLVFIDRMDCPYGEGKWMPDPMVVGRAP